MRFSILHTFFFVTALPCLAGCSTAQRASRDEPSAFAAEPQVHGYDAEAGAGEVTQLDGGFDAGIAANEPPRYEILAASRIADAGELRVEEIDGGYGFRLAAHSDASLSIEPIGKISGPTTAGVYLGPRCPEVAFGQTKLLGRWTGEVATCTTVAQPIAVLSGSEPRVGCSQEPAEPGEYELALWPCGSYDEPLVAIRFSLGDAEVDEAPIEETPTHESSTRATKTTGSGEDNDNPLSGPAHAPGPGFSRSQKQRAITDQRAVRRTGMSDSSRDAEPDEPPPTSDIRQ